MATKFEHITIIYNIYGNAKSCVKLDNNLSDLFPCNIGVRQGKNLDPTTIGGLRKLSKTSLVSVVKPKAVVKAVKGSLKCHQRWWIDNEPNLYIVNVIQYGYILPLMRVPERIFWRNNLSACLEPDFVQETITDLLKLDVI